MNDGVPDPKTEYLVCFDYGIGGLWAIVRARSEDEITRRYPELTVFRDPPPWMSPADRDRYRATELHDVDEAPWGVLDVAMKDRERTRGRGGGAAREDGDGPAGRP